MGLIDIYSGRQRWSDYLDHQFRIDLAEKPGGEKTNSTSEPALPLTRQTRLAISLGLADYETSVQAGLGAVDRCPEPEASGGQPGTDSRQSLKAVRTIEFGPEKLACGIESLNADFNLLIGDVIWRLELQQDWLTRSLQEIRLAEFERDARPFRSRAERAYLNGWYEEAVSDFVEAAKRNYPDFAVHRSLASILLYHRRDLAGALESYRKAAKYARPSDSRQAAEACYFAAIICVMERRLIDAADNMGRAKRLNPNLLEAHYQSAWISALAGDFDDALESLEPAIKGDPRYFERAARETVFDAMGTDLSALLDRLTTGARSRASELKHDADQLKNYVIVSPDAQRVSRLFEEIDHQMAGPLAPMAGLAFLETLSRAEQEMSDIHERFNKRRDIDAKDYVRSIAFSPDGRLLGAGFLNGGVQVWDVDEGSSGLDCTGHFASVNSVAFSPDNQLLATGSRDRTVKVWDVAAGYPLLTLFGHTDEVRAVAFSPDGQWLASAGHDRTVRIWRVETGREVQVLPGHSGNVTSAIFSPDGGVLATGSSDKTVKLWDVASGSATLTLQGHTRGVASLAFSADGRSLASGGEDRVVRVWDAGSGRQVRTLKGHRYSVTSLAFSPDGRILAAGSLGQTIILWRVATGAAISNLKYGDISYYSVAFSPKGQWLAFGSRDIQLWLKAVLTNDQYAAIRAREGGAHHGAAVMVPTHPPPRYVLDRFAEPKVAGRGHCEVCSRKLGPIERAVFRRCKQHR